DSHIRNLRDKLKTAGFPIEEFLKTVWGIGYKWN
ncbi:winged helix-turn-helix domain-containing protein, partial [Microvirga sp. 3-52]|nr:winged helix-turn-helix domain-containing protein [Microvirga sp. 3-52]